MGAGMFAAKAAPTGKWGLECSRLKPLLQKKGAEHSRLKPLPREKEEYMRGIKEELWERL